MVLTTRFKVLMAVAAAVGVYIVVTAPDPEGKVAAVTATERPVREGAAPVAVTSRKPSQGSPDRSGSLFRRLARRVTDAQAAQALFGEHSWFVAPPPPPPPPPAPPVAEAPPPPPSAPPLPFSVMGSYTPLGGSAVYFLIRGDRVFDVHVGDTLDNTYSVDGAANGQLTLTYKPLNIQQSLAIGDSK